MTETDPSEIAYEQPHIDQSRQMNMAVSNAICLGVAFVAVLLRLLSRRLAGTKNGADDWWVWTALILYTVNIIAYSCNAHYGLGRHSILIKNLKGFIISGISVAVTYNLTIFAIKMSLIFFYRRIFPPRWFHYALVVTGVIVGSYSLAYLLVEVIQCVPVKISLNTFNHSKCLNLGIQFFVGGITNVLTDVTILILPLPLVVRLQVSVTKKWLICGTFMLGGCACIISIVRVAFARKFKGTDAAWNNVVTAELSTVELGIGILSACLPTYRPLYNYVFHGKATANSPGYRWERNRRNARIVRVSNSWPGLREGLGDSDKEEELLCTSARLGTTTEVKGEEETGDSSHGKILVMR